MFGPIIIFVSPALNQWDQVIMSKVSNSKIKSLEKEVKSLQSSLDAKELQIVRSYFMSSFVLIYSTNV